MPQELHVLNHVWKALKICMLRKIYNALVIGFIVGKTGKLGVR